MKYTVDDRFAYILTYSQVQMFNMCTRPSKYAHARTHSAVKAEDQKGTGQGGWPEQDGNLLMPGEDGIATADEEQGHEGIEAESGNATRKGCVKSSGKDKTQSGARKSASEEEAIDDAQEGKKWALEKKNTMSKRVALHGNKNSGSMPSFRRQGGDNASEAKDNRSTGRGRERGGALGTQGFQRTRSDGGMQNDPGVSNNSAIPKKGGKISGGAGAYVNGCACA